MSTYCSQFSKPEQQHNLLAQSARADETQCVDALLAEVNLTDAERGQIATAARTLVEQVRVDSKKEKGFDAFLAQYDLSSEEGIALMCLAEAMLRVPDKVTITDLIRDKLGGLDKQDQVLKNNSFFANAAGWGLIVTGNILGESSSKSRFGGMLRKLVGRMGEPLIRQVVGQAMKLLGQQFVMGRGIDEAVKRAQPFEAQGYRYSYDMLGEAACTHADATRYFESYQAAIRQLVDPSDTRTLMDRPGLSVKLSALHPRYEYAHQADCVEVLTERLRELVMQAKAANIAVTVDAEEADRLELSLRVFANVYRDPGLADWPGFGLAVQAYQKRAVAVLDWLVTLGREQGRRIPVRLIKGAYWDTEIKDSQVRGLEGYPVFTRKASTDLSYLVCTQRIVAALDVIYPQFATHNAYTVATVMQLMQGKGDYEFQCLHGMGRVLYQSLKSLPGQAKMPVRMYAPVGNHQDLLPYLVRRLLENGANASFVNRVVDDNVPIAELVADPVATVAGFDSKAHPNIGLPSGLFAGERANSCGQDLTDVGNVYRLATAMDTAPVNVEVTPILAPSIKRAANVSEKAITDPADRRRHLGGLQVATAEEVEAAVMVAEQAHLTWSHQPAELRATCLRRAADLLEEQSARFMAILIAEAGKIWPDAIDEIREAVDFLRFYAAEAERKLIDIELPGPTGESNTLRYVGRGVFLCISPWNFPLAIFIGQVSAALAAGNTVLAKPATQTTAVAAEMLRLMYEAGVPREVLQLLPGSAEITAKPLIGDERIAGVMVTGSTATAKSIQRNLAKREGPIVPLIAETGGQNAMIVDSTALPEQVVHDVVESAFKSAGQRCSALRVLFVQEEVADSFLNMLTGAMETLVIGDPRLLSTDVGPVIDEAAKASLVAHQQYLATFAKQVYQLPLTAEHAHGSFFAPCVYEIDSLSQLKDEVFGPILHVVRYQRDQIDQVLADINATGYGLTLGVHSRIGAFAEYIRARVKVGNVYVNRNMIGAVVGVQPFGGEGLSGTGPKAGGPNYLLRLCKERTFTVNTTAVGGNATLMAEVD